MDAGLTRRNYIEINDPTINFGGISSREAQRGPETSPTPEALAQEAFSNLRKDLGLSFMASQGIDEDQGRWLHAVAHYYKSTWSQEKLDQLSTAIEAMDDTILATESGSTASATASGKHRPEMRSPKQHESTVQGAQTRAQYPVSRQAQFSKHWTEFRKWLTDNEPVERNNGMLTLPADEVMAMTDRMVQRDLWYQAADKPRGGGHLFAKGDPHSSIFQTHALQGVSTGSEAYDAIFGAMHNLYDATVVDGQFTTNVYGAIDMMENVGRLRDSWQANHPGQEFDSSLDRSEALRVRIAPALGALASSTV